MGASLSHYTLFAIAPILLVATAIAGLVFGAEAVRGEIVGQLDHLVGREGALAVQSLLEGAAHRRAGFVATTVGGMAFLVAATGAFLELQVAFNTIWRVKANPDGQFYAFVVDRRRSLGLVVALGQSAIASSYGAAGSMMILLLWVYYSCQILLYGAEFRRVWAARHGPGRSRSRLR